MRDDQQKDADRLLAYSRRGDSQALEELVQRHHARAYRFFLRTLGSPTLADDAAQDAFVALIRGAGRFEEGRSFGSWWGGILANTARSAVRKRSAQTRREERAARRPSVEPEAQRAAEGREIEAHVRRLPEDVRTPILLHFYGGQTYREVANTLGCPEGTASSRIRRGMKTLRDSLTLAGHGALVPALGDLLGGPGSTGPTPAAPQVRALEASAAVGTAQAVLAKAAALGSLLALVLLVGWTLTVPGDAPAARPSPGAQPPEVAQLDTATLVADGPRETSSGAADSKERSAEPVASPQPETPSRDTAIAGDPVTPAIRPSRLRGRILDATTLQPIPGAALHALCDPGPTHDTVEIVAVADSRGEFEVGESSSPPKPLWTLVRADGYTSFLRTFQPEDTQRPHDLLLSPGGDGRVEGRVVDAHGQPVAGVELWFLMLLGPTPSRGLVFGESTAPAQIVPRSRIVTRITSDAMGHFGIGGLPLGAACSVSLVEGQGYGEANGSSPGPAPASETPVPYVLHVVASAHLSLRIVDADGRPEGDASLSFGRLGATERVDSNGRLERDLSPGTHRVFVGFPWSEGAAEDRRRDADERLRALPDVERSITLTAGQRVEMTLRAPSDRGRVTCSAVDWQGGGVPNAEIWLVPSASKDWQRHLTAVTDSAGRAVFHGLTRGSYCLATEVKPWDATSGLTPVLLAGSEVSAELRTRRRAPLSGVVLSASGTPVAGATIMLNGSGAHPLPASDAQGRFSFERVPEGVITISANATGFEHRSIPHLHRRGREAVVELDPTSQISVRAAVAALARDGSEVPDGLEVRTWLTVGKETQAWKASTRLANRRFAVDYAAALGSEGTLFFRIDGQLPVAVPVTAGQPVDLEVVLERGHEVTGSVDRSTLGGRAVRIQSRRVGSRPWIYEALTEEDGSFTLKGLPEGPLELRFSTEANGEETPILGKRVTISPRTSPNLGRVVLEPTARAGGPTRSVLRFEVVDPTAALARAGFKTGDELVALNGSTQQLYQVPELLRVATPQGGSVTLSIRRGTETLQLKLDLGVAVPSSEAGGQLRLVRLKRGQE